VQRRRKEEEKESWDLSEGALGGKVQNTDEKPPAAVTIIPNSGD
jgi:hypothetical protein